MSSYHVRLWEEHENVEEVPGCITGTLFYERG